MLTLTLIKTFGYNCLGLVLTWFALSISIWIGSVIYSFATCRYKKITLGSIGRGYGLRTYYLVDTESNYYFVEANHLLGTNDLLKKVNGLSIGLDYQVKIYGFDSQVTRIKLIDLKPC